MSQFAIEIVTTLTDQLNLIATAQGGPQFNWGISQVARNLPQHQQLDNPRREYYGFIFRNTIVPANYNNQLRFPLIDEIPRERPARGAQPQFRHFVAGRPPALAQFNVGGDNNNPHTLIAVHLAPQANVAEWQLGDLSHWLHTRDPNDQERMIILGDFNINLSNLQESARYVPLLNTEFEQTIDGDESTHRSLRPNRIPPLRPVRPVQRNAPDPAPLRRDDFREECLDNIFFRGYQFMDSDVINICTHFKQAFFDQADLAPFNALRQEIRMARLGGVGNIAENIQILEDYQRGNYMNADAPDPLESEFRAVTRRLVSDHFPVVARLN